jgi:hypothetical protein
MKSIIKRYGSHIEILIITIIPLGWLIIPIFFLYRRNKERKKIDEKIDNLRLKMTQHKKYFYDRDYSTNFRKQLLTEWEVEKNNISNEMYQLGEKHTTVRQSRLLRLITLQIYHFELKL